MCCAGPKDFAFLVKKVETKSYREERRICKSQFDMISCGEDAEGYLDVPGECAAVNTLWIFILVRARPDPVVKVQSLQA